MGNKRPSRCRCLYSLLLARSSCIPFGTPNEQLPPPPPPKKKPKKTPFRTLMRKRNFYEISVLSLCLFNGVQALVTRPFYISSYPHLHKHRPVLFLQRKRLRCWVANFAPSCPTKIRFYVEFFPLLLMFPSHLPAHGYPEINNETKRPLFFY